MLSLWLTYGNEGFKEIKEFLNQNYHKDYTLSIYNNLEQSAMEVICDFDSMMDVIFYVVNVEHDFPAKKKCLSPAKKYKLYKSSINKSLHFVQRSLSSSTRVHRVTAQLNLSREWKNRMTTVVISAILNPVSRVSTPH